MVNVSIQIRSFLRVCCFLVVFWSSANAVGQTMVECTAPDTKGFAVFLKKFEENVGFQRTRIIFPLVVREGEYSMTVVQVSLWDFEKVQSLSDPLILSKAQRKKAFVAEDILLNTKRYAEVFHDGPPESDLYRMLYKFRAISGCWYLEELHDKSE